MVEEIGMEPYELAKLVAERVIDYCKHHSGDISLECVADHSPDQLDEFIDAYLKGNEAEELDKAIESSPTFMDEVKKEYEALWRGWIVTEVGLNLGDDIDLALYSITDNPRLNNTCKARRLKVFADVLDKFGDTVLQALQEKKPLSRKDLYYWLTELGDVAFGGGNYDYDNDVDYYLSYYDELNDEEKLDMLDVLLNEIDEAMSTTNEWLRELGVLTNES